MDKTITYFDKYILDGKTPVLEPNIYKWGKWYQNANRVVAQDTVGEQFISTVFLGIDHSWHGEKPELFETMIFDEDGNSMGYQERSSTWEEAEKKHYEIVKYLLTLNPEVVN